VSPVDRASVTAALDRVLDAPANPRAVAVFRIALAGMLAIVFHSGVTAEWIGPARSSALVAEVYRVVVHTDPYWWLIVALLAAFALGAWPRPVGFTLVVLLAPLVLREGRFPGRLVLLFTLLAFSFLRSDAWLSIRASRRETSTCRAGPMWPILLIQVQLSLLYGVNALAKSTEEFLRGDVLMAQSLMLPNFFVSLSDGALNLGPFAVPVWAAAVAAALTEYALALGFWFRRTRLPTALLGIAFHLALSRIMRIGLLDVVAVFLYSAFLLPFSRGDPVETGDGRAEDQVRSVARV
jgi:hypothetical protein